jgi:methyltransferase
MGVGSLAPFGLPQIAALLILLQRGAEELHSRRNTLAIMAEGAEEVGAAYYPVVATTHLAWIAALAFLIPATANVHSFPLVAVLVLQPVRYWIIANYGVTLAETFVLPLAFGQLAVALIFTVGPLSCATRLFLRMRRLQVAET